MSDFMQLREVRVVGETDWIEADEICKLCRLDLQAVAELADLGLVSPRGSAPPQWQFPATAMPRLAMASRLIRDLGVNVSGAVLAVELLEAQRELERRVRRLEQLIQP